MIRMEKDGLKVIPEIVECMAEEDIIADIYFLHSGREDHFYYILQIECRRGVAISLCSYPLCAFLYMSISQFPSNNTALVKTDLISMPRYRSFPFHTLRKRLHPKF